MDGRIDGAKFGQKYALYFRCITGNEAQRLVRYRAHCVVRLAGLEPTHLSIQHFVSYASINWLNYDRFVKSISICGVNICGKIRVLPSLSK